MTPTWTRSFAETLFSWANSRPLQNVMAPAVAVFRKNRLRVRCFGMVGSFVWPNLWRGLIIITSGRLQHNLVWRWPTIRGQATWPVTPCERPEDEYSAPQRIEGGLLARNQIGPQRI